MRLMDLLVGADRSGPTKSHGAHDLDLPAAAAFHAAAIRDCPLRYVLGDQVALLCERLLETDAGMLDPANAFLRLPTEHFWMEWTLPASGARYPQKVGCLIAAATDGRSGTVHSFWVDGTGRAQGAQVYLEFDLDHSPAWFAADICRANHSRPELRLLLKHVAFRIEPAWLPYFRTLAPAGRDLFFDACVARIWFDLPMAFAFAALLNAESYVATERSELGKLNRSRAARGRPALLDYVETRLCLGRAAEHGSGGNGTRNTPRLHSVRGHMVRRHDTTFWRMTHLRGDPSASQLTKTIQVSHRHGA